ncbi:hypothetical protein HDV05_003542 [Chytridiales sp. JEL 0842]|nr:hypothetical protein HDV05_003542 [Chytridiales sp. JEL 0842]
MKFLSSTKSSKMDDNKAFLIATQNDIPRVHGDNCQLLSKSTVMAQQHLPIFNNPNTSKANSTKTPQCQRRPIVIMLVSGALIATAVIVSILFSFRTNHAASNTISSPVQILNTTKLAKRSTTCSLKPENNAFSGLVPNPDRGFYRYTEYRSSSPQRLRVNSLNDMTKPQSITLIYHLIVLDTFKTNPTLSTSVLDDIRANFEAVRQAGLTMLLRFAYTIDYTGSPPYGDASHDVVVSHIRQLTPLLQANGDVISVLQQGFIGTWGEGYYTDHYGGPKDGYDPNTGLLKTGITLDRRIEVMNLLLRALPAQRPLATRYAGFLQQFFERTRPSSLTSWRVFLHNDCFLASTSTSPSGKLFSTDFGTFNTIEQWQTYANIAAPWGPTGGETCNMNKPSTNCDYALNQLQMFGFAYLNIEYLKDVLDDWRAQGCFEQVRRRLGYRFVLNQFSVASRGDRLQVDFDGVNEGWGRVFNQKRLSVIARGQFPGNRTVCQATFSRTDVRFWGPKGEKFAVSATVGFPFNVANVMVSFQIQIRDTLAKKASDVQGNILFANLVPNLETRLNDVGSTMVNVQIASTTRRPLYSFSCV